jgi:hypothetical protein
MPEEYRKFIPYSGKFAKKHKLKTVKPVQVEEEKVEECV